MRHVHATRLACVDPAVQGSLALVGLTSAATQRHRAALVRRAGTVKKMAALKALKMGGSGPYTFII